MNVAEAPDRKEQFLVGPSWIANAYGVSIIDVHRAIHDGRIKATRIRGHKADGWAIDVRSLPDRFPYKRKHVA